MIEIVSIIWTIIIWYIRVFPLCSLLMKKNISARSLIVALREKCLYLELFWFIFSCIWTEYERYYVSLGIQSKCGKIRTRIIRNMDTFYAVLDSRVLYNSMSTKNLSILYLLGNNFFIKTYSNKNTSQYTVPLAYTGKSI